MAASMHSLSGHPVSGSEIPARLFWSRAGRLMLFVLLMILLLLLLPVGVHASNSSVYP